MKLQKCWLSAGALTSLLIALCAADAEHSATSNSFDVIFNANNDIAEKVFEGASAETEHHKLGANFSRLVNLFSNVYINRDAFIREVISNALDAIQKVHQARLANAKEDTLDSLDQYKIVVHANKEKGIITFTDNGIGMTKDELKEYLGTIAESGTANFKLDAKGNASAEDASLIGQFGVGFYSSLLVADEIVVSSMSEKSDAQWMWKSGKDASYYITKDPRGNTLSRGTEVILRLKKDAKEYLDADRLETIIKNYFGHDRHRIYLVKPKTITEEVPLAEDEAAEESKDKDDEATESGDKEKPEVKDEAKPKTKKIEKVVEEAVLVSQSKKPIWKRKPTEVTREEYNAFYQTIANDRSDPLSYIHLEAEGSSGESFRAILFVPKNPPFGAFTGQDVKPDIKLHVRGVFVTAKLDDFIPRHLSWVRGIIDSDDLPLNISRDVLQNTAGLRGIRKKIINKIIELMTKMAENEPEKYEEFYNHYSNHIKLHLMDKEENRTIMARLLRFRSTKTPGGKMTSIENYIERLSEKLKEKRVVYYLSGKADEIDHSPFLAKFQEKDIEVLLMTDPIDDHAIQSLDKFDGYKLENIAKDGIKLDEDDEKVAKDFEENYKDAKKYFEQVTKDTVEKVSFVPGPANIPGSMKSSQFGWTGNTERIAMAQATVKDDPMMNFFLKQKKILELNPKNAVVKEIMERAQAGKKSPELRAMISTLTESIMVWSGYSVRDPPSFVAGVNRLIASQLNVPFEPLPEEPKEEEKKASPDHNLSEDDEIEVDKDSDDGEASEKDEL